MICSVNTIYMFLGNAVVLRYRYHWTSDYCHRLYASGKSQSWAGCVLTVFYAERTLIE